MNKGFAFMPIAVIVGVILIILVFSFFALNWKAFFDPKFQNVDRKTFENTKSYVHGKIQDLAKYYEEYQKAKTSDDKMAIANVIKMNFAGFDSKKISNLILRNFLKKIRSY